MISKKALGKGLDALIQRGLNKQATPPAPAAPAVPPPAPVPASVAPPAPVVAAPVPPPAPVSPAPAPAPEQSPAHAVLSVELSRIRANRFQPRSKFEEEALHDLTASIREHGILQPLVVRKAADGNGYELIAGERRFRAAREVGLATVPVLVRDVQDQVALELALIENLQRQDLNAIEESKGYQQLIEQFSLTQEQVSVRVGKSRTAVANSLRLLSLPDQVQAWVRDGQLTVGHAKAILGLTVPEEMTITAERVIREQLNVRDCEKLVEKIKSATGRRQAMRRKRGEDVEKPPHISALEDAMCQKLGTKVTIHPQTTGGFIHVEFYNDADLDRLGGLLGNPIE